MTTARRFATCGCSMICAAESPRPLLRVSMCFITMRTMAFVCCAVKLFLMGCKDLFSAPTFCRSELQQYERARAWLMQGQPDVQCQTAPGRPPHRSNPATTRRRPDKRLPGPILGNWQPRVRASVFRLSLGCSQSRHGPNVCAPFWVVWS